MPRRQRTRKAHRKPKCPECKGATTLKNGKLGPFFGCLLFPECRGRHPADADGRPIRAKRADKATFWARTRLVEVMAKIARDLVTPDVPLRRAEAAVRGWLAEVTDIKKCRPVDLTFEQCVLILQRAEWLDREALRRRMRARLDARRGWSDHPPAVGGPNAQVTTRAAPSR